ncbi:ATP-binding cassette domain-containing protein [Hymenobacter taeanensis]|uniref:ATP-binding cassette domain-containing protein n=1 Tax=Hymenobacter taeanensis TaxID=2735321 RepID=A0A6M6BBC3_9BACT|nr:MULTISPECIES: ATP-binding cassette domain-containing protein [Hymenobacter]QJX45576.1 ATP-binding cassette domain-containing protein [Hymenobacter taeanensis]UOQ81175.1 ATP-binding cassette domain-containing protein [Hymenobacter sp. 5414T-23]
MSRAASYVLEADGIQLAFGERRILSDVYLRVQTGQVVGLLGRNGCGKSTLLQTVFGGRTLADASVRVNGQRVVPAYRQPGLLNYLPQVPLLPERLTLAEAARMLGVNAEQALAGFPGLSAQLTRRIGELSGGTTRLVQVLLLLHAKTQFSLFDEPFSGVMPVHVETLAELFRQAKARKGILLTDHRYAEVLPLCDVVYLLHGGRLEQLPPDPVPALRDRGYLAS